MAKTERIEARATAEEKELIRRGAAVANEHFSSFVVAAAIERSQALLVADATTAVPGDFFDALYEDLDRPGEPNEALLRAARRPRRVSPA